MIKLKIFAASLLLIGAIISDVEAQRFGGGRAGGGRSGGISRQSSGFSRSGASRSYHSPTMSRSVSNARPNQTRSSSQQRNVQSRNVQGVNNRVNSTVRGSGTTRNSSLRNNPSSARSNTQRNRFPGQNQTNSQGRTTRSQLDNFLNGSHGSSSRSSRSSSVSTKPGNSIVSSGSNSGSKTFTTANGHTITVGAGGGKATGAGGGSVGGAAGGIKIETAGGQTVVKGKGGVGASDGQGNRAGAAVGGVGASDGQGNRGANVRGVAGDSQGNRRAGSVTARQNQWGYTKVNARGASGNINTGNGTARSVNAVRGPAGNTLSAGRGRAFVNGQFVGGNAWTAVNGRYTRYGYFGPGYYNRYPNAWWPGKWAFAATAWTTTTWAVAGSYCGCAGGGMYYDYEDNVSYVDGSVYYGDEAVATEEQYYDQAEEIAEAGVESTDEEWLPLGVFAFIKESGQTETDKVVQLALNREGIVRGNMQDLLTDKVIPVSGSVDKESQRVALKLEGVDNLIVEVGLYNLTNDEVPILLHRGADTRDTATLIRLENPEEGEANNSGQ